MQQTITLKQMREQARRAHMALKGSDTTNIALNCNNAGSIHVKPSEAVVEVVKKVKWADIRQQQRRK